MDYDITRIHWYTPRSPKTHLGTIAEAEGIARRKYADKDLFCCGWSTNQRNGIPFSLYTTEPDKIIKMLEDNDPRVERRYSLEEYALKIIVADHNEQVKELYNIK